MALDRESPAVLTAAEAARFLRLDEESINDLLDKGELGGLKIGDQWRVPVDSLEKFVEDRILTNNLRVVEKTFYDKAAWKNALNTNTELKATIQQTEYGANTFGKFLQDALDYGAMDRSPERKTIPRPLIFTVADVLGTWYYSHTRLNTLFGELGAPGDIPEGNCITKCQKWLFRVNDDSGMNPIGFLEELISEFMNLNCSGNEKWEAGKQKLELALEKQGLVYTPAGQIILKTDTGKVAVEPSIDPIIDALSPGKRFAIALSFPGEHRSLVERVAETLGQTLQRTRVFYDRWYEHELARPNLDLHLQNIYHDDSCLVVVFLCEAYEKKEWPGLEWRAIRDLIKRRRSEDIMFIRLDTGGVSGTFSIDGHIDAVNKSPTEIAKLILARLEFQKGGSDGTTDSPVSPSASISLIENERDILLAIPDDGWISTFRTDAHGTTVCAGEKQFFDPVDPSYQARFLDAFESLVAQGYIREEGGGTFKLTGRGFEARSKLKSEGTVGKAS